MDTNTLLTSSGGLVSSRVKIEVVKFDSPGRVNRVSVFRHSHAGVFPHFILNSPNHRSFDTYTKALTGKKTFVSTHFTKTEKSPSTFHQPILICCAASQVKFYFHARRAAQIPPSRSLQNEKRTKEELSICFYGEETANLYAATRKVVFRMNPETDAPQTEAEIERQKNAFIDKLIEIVRKQEKPPKKETDQEE
jgi:hypothetical protein